MRVGSTAFKPVVEFTSCAFCKSSLFRNGKVHVLLKVPRLTISTFLDRGPLKGSKKDYYAEEKMPIFDYGKIHSEKKRLYVFGASSHGALGLENLIRPKESHQKKMFFMQRPVRHVFGDTHTVTDIAVGHGFTLFAVKPKKENGPVMFGCGLNTKSQLGFQPNGRDQPLGLLITVVPIPLPLSKSSKVLALGAGRGHTLISVEGNGILTLGENTRGQCGRRIIEDEEYLGSKLVCKIPQFGPTNEYDVIICLTKMGTVYTFGANEQGQLGRGKIVTKPWVPVQLEGDLKGQHITKVATSDSSVLALSDKGELFGWGCNDCGQIDPNQISNIHFEPVHVKLPRRVGKIIDVAVGDMFTLVLNGLGPKNTVVKTPNLMPPPLFGRNEFSPDVSVVKIAASSKFAAAVNSIGDLYTWGKNDDGCLGLGQVTGGYQFFPLKVALGGPAHKLSLGPDHAVIMAKAGY